MAEQSLLDEVSETIAIERQGSGFYSIVFRASMMAVAFLTVTVGLMLNSVAQPWLFGIATCTIMMWMRGNK